MLRYSAAYAAREHERALTLLDALHREHGEAALQRLVRLGLPGATLATNLLAGRTTPYR